MILTISDLMWLVAAASIIGCILNVKKLKESYLIWTATNIAFATYNWYIGSYAQSVNFIACLCTSVWGIYEWYKNAPEKIYLVGWRNAEEQFISKACKSRETALKEWDRVRLNLLSDLERDCDAYKGYLYIRIRENLSETDPDKMDNYPHDEPFIQEISLEE